MIGSGRRSTRGRSSSAGILLFIVIGAVLTASGAYLMLQLGDDDIGGPANAVFDASQEDGLVILEHSTGDPIAGDNLRVVGGTVAEMPAEISTGDRLEVRPTAGEVRLLFESGRVSQELARIDAELARLVVRVADGNGTAIAGRTVGIYDLGARPGLASPAALRAEINRTGEPPAPTLVGATDANGEFVITVAARDALSRDGEYAVLTATAGTAGDRVYDVRAVTIDDQENAVALAVPS